MFERSGIVYILALCCCGKAYCLPSGAPRSRQLLVSNLNSTNKNWKRDETSSSIAYHDCEFNATRIINLEMKPVKRVLLKDINKYLLYTRENLQQAQQLYIHRPESMSVSNFNPADPTIVVVHDWKGNRKSKLNPTIRDAFLSVEFANIIVVDWSLIASEEYVTASLATVRVGRFLGQFLQFLHISGAPYSTMHLVGFGLGAHVAGNAGDFLQPSARVARITGLDPAGPLWEKNVRRLHASNAVYVEVIHTDGHMLGMNVQSGHVDFYPNGGVSQPACMLLVPNSCNHERAWQMFAATVKFNHLVGRRCSTYDAFTLNVCYNEYLPMGNDDLLKNGSGMYRVTTEGGYPYPQKF